MEKLQKTSTKPIPWAFKIGKQKLPKKLQANILRYIGELYEEGFSLQEILPFLRLIELKYADHFKEIEAGLSRGELFYQHAKNLNLSDNIIYQIYIAETRGNFAEGLLMIANYIEEQDRYRKKMQATLAYPLFLVMMVIVLIFALRLFMLPHLKSFIIEDPGLLTQILLNTLDNLPFICMLLLGGLLLLIGGVSMWFHRHSPLKQAQILASWPLIGRLTRNYYAYFFAYEFSQLLKIGYSFKEIVHTFSSQTASPLLADLGKFLEQGYEEGLDFPMRLHEADIFTPECQAIVAHGEQVSNLSAQLRLYAKRCLKAFFSGIEQFTRYFKSLLFFTVALLIVSVYLLLMLPMLSMIGGIQ